MIQREGLGVKGYPLVRAGGFERNGRSRKKDALVLLVPIVPKKRRQTGERPNYKKSKSKEKDY